MQKRRFGFIAIGFFMTASIWACPALADMFYYRDARGQLHLTNVWSRIPSAHRSQAARNRRPEQGGPTQDVGELAKLSPSSPQDDQMAKRPATASPQAAPVSTQAFGLLSLQMSDFEVIRRLGPPAAISDVGERALASTDHRSRVIRIVQSDQSWYYPGTSRIPATRLEFQGGVLVRKRRIDR